VTGEFDRGSAVRRLRSDDFDILVVGGGITGAGVALDAAARGLRTALVERHDFASGTSSKSSKLVHGGFRYLQQREFRLVYEALYERQRVLHNAPHLVRVLPFLVPVLKHGGVIDRRLSRLMGTALWAYDVTGGLRIGKRHARVSIDDAVAHMPTLARERLAGAYVLYDAQADDARLTLTIARTAAARGAAVANYASVTQLLKGDGRVVGARVLVDGEEIEVRARCVVNAAGVWADDVRALDEGANPASIRPAKGVHITLPWDKVANDIAAIVPVAADGRTVFVVPWGDFTYVGTTDTEYDGPLDDPACTADDVAYLLGALNGIVREPLGPDDVTGTWAGLRPLLKGARRERTADLSRRHAVRVSQSGVVTVTGGKLTTYRRMAADAVDAAAKDLGGSLRRSLGRSPTKRLRLVGSDGFDAPALTLEPPSLERASLERASLELAEHDHLAGRYGSEAADVLELIRADPRLREPLVPGLPYLKAEARFAVRHEMARTLSDVLDRRTRARLLARDAAAAAAVDVAALVGPDLGWSAEQAATEVAAYRASITFEREQSMR
jgi:glycerol-3-phosphate dehydrogenase